MYGPIEIRNSCIVIHNYELGDNERLEKLFTYSKKVYGHYQYFFMALKYNPKDKELYVPGGVELYYILDSFYKEGNNKVLDKISPDPYDSTGNIFLKKPPRNDRQKKAIRFCLGLEEYVGNRNQSQISLNLDTGVGKTYVAIFVVSYYEVKTMVIASSTDWLEQWKERIIEYTNLTEDDIYIISGMPSIVKLRTGLKDPNKIKIYLSTHDTLANFAKNNTWKKIRELFNYLKIGIKIYDEAHLDFENICKIDFNTNCWKTYYLTATPMKSDFGQNKVYQISFKTIPKISLYDEREDPHTSYLAVLFNSHPTGKEIDRCYDRDHGFSMIKYVDYIINKPIFYKMLKLILNRVLCELKPGIEEKAMLYIGKNEAILKAYYWIKYNYPNISCGIYTSLTPKQHKHEQLNNKIILTTTKSANACLDIPGLKKNIVFAEPFSSLVYAKQILGRTRDKDTEMIELVDVGFKRIKDWYLNKKNKTYYKYATECNEISFSTYEIDMYINDIISREQQELEERMKTHKHIVTIETPSKELKI